MDSMPNLETGTLRRTSAVLLNSQGSTGDLPEPKSVESKGAVLCERGNSDNLYHTPLSTTSSQAIAIVGKVETTSRRMVSSVLSDGSVGEVTVRSRCELKTVHARGDNDICKLIVKSNAWLVSMLLFVCQHFVLLLSFASTPFLKEALSALPLLNRLRFLRVCKFLFVMGSAPPLIAPESKSCEFPLRKPCDNKSVSVTTCCGMRRCEDHSEENYACCQWGLFVPKPRRGAPERRLIDVEVGLCEMAAKPPHPGCFDCDNGILCFRHGEICRNIAWIACEYCTKYKCHVENCKYNLCCAELIADMIKKLLSDKNITTSTPEEYTLSSNCGTSATLLCRPAAMLSGEFKRAYNLSKKRQVIPHKNNT